MGVFTDGYVMHPYEEWLLTTVANILDDDLSISSAGLLREGAVAWVEVSVPEAVTTPEASPSARTCWRPLPSTGPSPPPSSAR